MKRCLALPIMILFFGASASHAQATPRLGWACPFPSAGFATSLSHVLQIAEVSTQGATRLGGCDSPKGCYALRVARRAPVLLYKTQDGWTCGYVSGRNGSGPAWIQSKDLRLVRYNSDPLAAAWLGTWTGGEDRVVIRLGLTPGTLHIAGDAMWNGGQHFGDMKGDAVPNGNRIHFVQNGPEGCTIDMALLNRYIVAQR